MSERFEKPMYAILGGQGKWYFPAGYRRDVSGSVVGALSNVTDIVRDVQGLLPFQLLEQIPFLLRINELRKNLDVLLAAGRDAAEMQVKAGDIGDMGLLFDYVYDFYDKLLYNWRQGFISGDGAAFSGFMEKMIGADQFLYSLIDLRWQLSVTPRMKRNWMNFYRPSVPDTRMAFNLMRRGKISDNNFKTFASYDGWGDSYIDYLKALWRNVPNENTAFRMFARGAIDSKTKEAFYYANSWEQEDFKKLDLIYQWLPNAREAFSLFKRGAIGDQVKAWLYHAQGYMPDWHSFLDKTWQRLPTPRDAFTMYMRDTITEEEFDNYVEANEWEEGSAARLWNILQNLPNSQQAFRLFRRGKISSADLTALFKADGYMPTYQKIVSSLYERIPMPRDAFNALMRGFIDRKQFDTLISMNEWQDGMADFLYEIYLRQPSPHEAFYMWTKNIITLKQRDELYKANGYDSEWHNKMTANYYYVPTVYDLTRIADYVEMDLIWATKILKERGLRDKDISKITAMLKIRPLRDEIRRQIAIWVKRYRYGWVTPTQLEASLQEYLEGGYIQATEKTLTVEEAELNYEDELMTEKIEIYSWYYKTAVISEEELLEDFLDLGIREEKANLMVEVLKAQGYYGYY